MFAFIIDNNIADYWKKNYDMVRKLISEAEMYVAEENEEILCHEAFVNQMFLHKPFRIANEKP